MMKKISFLLTLLVMLFCASQVFAKTVTVAGMGSTATEAENDALRNAVEQTVGVLIDSKTMVEKNKVLNDQIYTQSKGFIRNYSVIDKMQNISGWTVTVEADVDDTPDSKLMTELTRLGIIDVQLRNPKIAVYIPEQHLRHRVPNSAAETEVVKAFVDAGFTNMIEASPQLARVNVNSYGWMLKPLYNISAEDMRNAARFFEADILVMGEAFSEGVGDVGKNLPGRPVTNTRSCRARVEGKMYIAKTGQIIAADGKYGSGADMSEAIASKKALASAGKQIGEYFVEKIITQNPNRQGIELVVKASDFTKINMVQSALGRVSGVKSVNLSKYGEGEGAFTIHYSGAPQSLFNALQAATDADLTLISTSYNTITISVF